MNTTHTQIFSLHATVNLVLLLLPPIEGGRVVRWDLLLHSSFLLSRDLFHTTINRHLFPFLVCNILYNSSSIVTASDRGDGVMGFIFTLFFFVIVEYF